MKVPFRSMHPIARSRLRLVFLIMLGCCMTAQAQYGPTSPYYAEPLAEVKEFHGSSIGFGSAPSPYYYKFQAEAAKGESAVPLLEQLLLDGTPAARLYAALALYSIDNDRGVRALESLKGDPSHVVTLFDCTRGGSTVGELAAAALDAYGKGAKDFFHKLTADDEPKDFLWR